MPTRRIESAGARCKDGDHPIVWSNEHYRARDVYFQFGHHGELLGNANFQELAPNAIHWEAE
jgi:type 1 glutamine amidotransferase